MILYIVKHPNDILRAKNEEISPEFIKTDEFHRLISDMKETMLKRDGVGLAAPQIGKNIQVCLINTEDGVLVLINPKIIKRSFRKSIDEEGCLSIPGVFGKVKRHKQIKVKTLTLKGEPLEINAEGMFARVIQHEVDHLNGILFIDKMVK
ncbi:MAG TPA: peptide deformylase [Candidatus Bipolaricaulota bacterium]|nr:peptide deformylase [Candidatus Bipolaricaulota bacterium]